MLLESLSLLLTVVALKSVNRTLFVCASVVLVSAAPPNESSKMTPFLREYLRSKGEGRNKLKRGLCGKFE